MDPCSSLRYLTFMADVIFCLSITIMYDPSVEITGKRILKYEQKKKKKQIIRLSLFPSLQALVQVFDYRMSCLLQSRHATRAKNNAVDVIAVTSDAPEESSSTNGVR